LALNDNGMGLRLIRMLTDQTNADVQITTNKGTTFSIILTKLIHDKLVKTSNWRWLLDKRKRRISADFDEKYLRRHQFMDNIKILIVEDEAIVAADLSNKLIQLGYRVAGIAGNGADAVEMATRLEPELVLMDIKLKGDMDGIEATHILQDSCNFPVIYLTAYSDLATLERAKITGPFGYILKPFEERELVIQIELALYKHKAEIKLRAQQELLQAILNSIADAVISVDLQENISFINPAAESLSGWSTKEANGKPLSRVFSAINEQTGRAIEPISTRVLQENRTVRIPEGSLLEVKGRSRIYVAGNGSPLLGGDGVTVGMLLTFQDVSDKIAQEQALRQSENLLKKAEEIAQLGSWEFDIEKGSFIWSDEESRIFGLKPGRSAPTYKNVLDMVHPDDIKKVDEAYQNSLQNDTMPYDIEHRIIRPNGEIRHVHEKCEHIRDNSGAVVRSVGITHDVTGYKKALMSLERSNRELEDFAYVASHDLQEPLRGIIGFLQLLQRRYKERLDDKGIEFIEYSVKAAHRMQSLIRELLCLSRLSSHPTVFVELDLDIIVNEVKENLQRLLKEKKAVVSAEKLPSLPIDTSMIHSLFQNLLTNAVKYNNSLTPTVTISCRQTGNSYQISVADNGIGIDEKFHQRIFTIFQRLHTEQEYCGTGMGLALCKKIVECHEGTIWVESTPGKGSTFHFTLPKSR